MNSNLIHNVFNVLIALSAGLAAFLLATGCTADAEGIIRECSQSFLAEHLSPGLLAGIAAVLGGIKSVINIGRDGLGGLFKKQPPVASNLTTVVVASNAEAGPAKVAVTGAMAATKK